MTGSVFITLWAEIPLTETLAALPSPLFDLLHKRTGPTLLDRLQPDWRDSSESLLGLSSM